MPRRVTKKARTPNKIRIIRIVSRGPVALSPGVVKLRGTPAEKKMFGAKRGLVIIDTPAKADKSFSRHSRTFRPGGKNHKNLDNIVGARGIDLVVAKKAFSP